MAKKKTAPAARTSVFAPMSYPVTIGENDYEIEPQPIKNVVAFQVIIERFSADFEKMSDRHLVTVTGADSEVLFSEGGLSASAGRALLARKEREYTPPDLDDPERDASLDAIIVLSQEPYPWRDLLFVIAEAPFPLLSVVIPDLTEGDADLITFPLLTHIFEVVVEVNGLNWFQDIVGNLVRPMLDSVGPILIDSVSTVIKESSGNGAMG